MKRILIFENTEVKREVSNTVQELFKALQETAKAFLAMDVAELDDRLLLRLHEGESLIRELLAAKAQLESVKLDEMKLRELVALPSNFPAFEASASRITFKENQKFGNALFSGMQLLKHFSFENGEVKIIDEKLQATLDSLDVYAESELEQQIYSECKQACDSLNKYLDTLTEKSIGGCTVKPDQFDSWGMKAYYPSYPSPKTRFKPDHSFIKHKAQ